MRIDPSDCANQAQSDNNADKQSETDAYQHHLFMQAPVAIMILKGSDYLVELANDFYLQIVDKNKDFIGKPIFKSLPELESQGIRQLLDAVMQSGKPYCGNELEVYLNRNNKIEQGFYNFIYQPIREQNNIVTGIIVVVTEVTEQVLARKNVEESEHRYHTMIHSSPSAIGILHGADLIITTANAEIIDLLGKGEDIIGKPYFELMPELAEQGYKEVFHNVYTTGKPFVAIETPVHILQNGKMTLRYYNFTLHAHRNVDGEILGVGIIASEVTSQAELNIKIKANEEKFRLLVQQAPVAICVLRGEDYVIEVINEPMYDMWDRTLEQVLNKPAFDVLTELKDQGFKKLLDNVYHKGERFVAEELPINLKRNGKLENAFVKFVYEPLREADGTISGVMALAHEITEQVIGRKKMEAQVLMVENLWMTAPGFICILRGPTHIYDLVNDQYQKLFGKRQLKGLAIMEALPELVGQGFDTLLDTVYNTGEPYLGIEIPILLARDEGLEPEIMYFNFSYQPMYDENKTIFAILVFGYEVTPQALSNQKTKENEFYFRLIAEYMPEKITNAKPDGTIIYYNKSWQEYTGASFDDLINHGWGKWIHPDELVETTRRWLHSVETGNNFDMDVQMLNHQGAYRWHSSRARAVKDENGQTKLWIGFNSDIHDQKRQREDLQQAVDTRTYELKQANESLAQKNQQLEDAQKKLLSGYSRSLIEASLDPLITINTEGVITDMNEAFSNITGESREQLIGTDFVNYFTDPQKAREIYEEVFAKGFVTNYPLTVIDGHLIDVLFNGSVYKDDKGNVLGAVVVARVITEQKRIEKELIEARVFAEMATLIAQEAKTKAEDATQIAEDATQIAEDAVKSKQQFLSNMSHEIRTPMNAIIGFTKVILKTELSAKQKEYLTAIKMSGDALIVLINDILDLAKVDAGKMTFEKTPFKLSVSISAMLHLFETKIQEKNLKLIKIYDPKIPEVLIGDPVRLHQIILNLLSNAVKFTSKGSITVNVSLLNEDEDQVTIEFAVTDTGIGIEAEKLDEIFENFHQASSDTSRLFGGTGLGLAIVKQLVEPQGGTIHVKSVVNEGTTFSFTLSFQKTDEKAELQTEIMAIDADIKNIKVLVVEDMALNQLLMKTVLDDFGFDRDIADNGKIAIEKLTQKDAHGATKEYDIILMDLQMPEMNGFEATEYIRKTLKSKIPIIALTADVTTVDLAKCKAVGMNDYIAKPVDERILYSKIVSFVKKSVSNNGSNGKEITQMVKQKCTNLEYLMQRTKANPILMVEMISAYLEQTPPLINAMKQSFQAKDWALLDSAVHKMIPSFSIMGMSTDFESMAKKVVEYARTQEQADNMADIVSQLESACTQACEELMEELKNLQNNKR